MKTLRFIVTLTLLTTCGCGDSNPLVSKARVELIELTKAVFAYHAAHAKFPESLETLAEPKSEGGAGLLTPGALNDPWGRPYQYDPGERHPQTDQPLIWSDGPEPGKKGSKIANWVENE